MAKKIPEPTHIPPADAESSQLHSCPACAVLNWHGAPACYRCDERLPGRDGQIKIPRQQTSVGMVVGGVVVALGLMLFLPGLLVTLSILGGAGDHNPLGMITIIAAGIGAGITVLGIVTLWVSFLASSFQRQ